MSDTDLINRIWTNNERTASDEHNRSLCPPSEQEEQEDNECDAEEALELNEEGE